MKKVGLFACLLILILIIAYMFWPYLYKINHPYVEIDNEEYYFFPSVICHSEREFKSIPIGTTFSEIEARFGLKNGWYNRTGAIGSYFYIVGPRKYIIIQLRASDELLEYVDSLTYKEFWQRDIEIVGMMEVRRIACANDKELLWEITE